MSLKDTAKKLTKSYVAITIALIVIFFSLNFLHQKFGGNFVGQTADKIGSLASGQKYQF